MGGGSKGKAQSQEAPAPAGGVWETSPGRGPRVHGGGRGEQPLVGFCPPCLPSASERGQSRPEHPLFLREREQTGSERGPLALLTQPLSQVHHINANYFLDITSMKPEDVENNVFSFSSTFEDPSTATYMQFLKEGLRRGLPLLQP